MSYITTRDNTQLFVKVWGTGKPVVLIHGWPLTSDSWDSVSFALANSGYKVIAYDRRGFGRSDQPWTGYDYDTLADDLADVMKATGVTGNAAIIGFSMGGGEVVRYMSRHKGANVTKAGLISSIAPFLLKTDSNPDGVAEKDLSAMAEGIEQDRAHFMKGFLKDFYGIGLLSNPVSDEVLAWSWSMCMQAGLKPTLACAEAFAQTDFRSEMAHINVPTLVIHGTKDHTVPIDATGRPAAQAITRATLIEYDGEPHGIIVTQEQRLIEDLQAFLRQ